MGKFYELDVEGTMKSTERESIFLSIPQDSSRILRFFPPVGDGKLFARNVNHFKLMEDDRGVAYGCLNEHGDGDCPLCKAWKYMINSENKALIKIAKEVKPSSNWYAQVLDGRKEDVIDDAGEYVLDDTGARVKVMNWYGPYLMRFSKTGADEINGIIRAQKVAGEPFITDPAKGKAVVFTRTGTGYDTKYKGVPMSDPIPMDKAFPTWKEAAFDDLYEKLEIKLKTPEQMIAAMTVAHSADWKAVLKEAGVS